jgi:hypothetical protein
VTPIVALAQNILCRNDKSILIPAAVFPLKRLKAVFDDFGKQPADGATDHIAAIQNGGKMDKTVNYTADFVLEVDGVQGVCPAGEA